MLKKTHPSIDPELGRAATLSSAFYLRPEVLDHEKRTVFAASWQLVGRLDQVSAPGDYLTATIADEPVIVVRDREGTLRALSNVCRHRAGPVASGCGNRKSFRCGYHGWVYALDGSLMATPEFENVQAFERSEVRLPSFQVDTWASLIFVRISTEGPTLQETLGDLPSRMMHSSFEEFRSARRKEWIVNCNWKVYVDNYLEGYHIPIVHPGLFRELDYDEYRTETLRYYSIQHAPIRRGERLPRESEDSQAQYFWIFPNLMINVYPDNYSTNLIVPLGVDKTLTIFEWFFPDPDSPSARKAVDRTVEFSDEIQIEDIAICETVQRGLRSATYERGRYSVKRENGVHHFHRLLAERYQQEADS